PSCIRRECRRRARAGRGCGRRSTRRRSPCRGSRRSSSPSPETRLSPGACPSWAVKIALVRPTAMYSAVAGLSWPLLHLAYRLRPRGLENLPADGVSVLACNHVSSFDPWPLGMPLWPKRQLRFMAKSELYWWPLTIVLKGAGAFRVWRGRRETQAIETSVQLVREGNVVAMFPEGTRRTKGLVKKFEARPRTGAARIALEGGV